MNLRTAASRILSATPLSYFPVRVRSGLAKGARWTLLPFSTNWRFGGSEKDVEIAASRLAAVTGAVFWDFGAHFGIHTVGMALQVGPSGEVAAFEPNAVAFQRLRYHVSVNELSNVKLFQAAVSSSTGFMSVPVPRFGASMLRLSEEESRRHSKYSTIKTIAVDDLVKSGELRLPDLIKIDIEGYGPQAIAGCLESLRRAQPLIVYSNHSDDERVGVASLLEPLGYTVSRLTGEPGSWRRLDDVVLLIPPTA